MEKVSGMSAENNDPFEVLASLSNELVFRDFLHHVSSVAGFSLPPSLKFIFEKHHKHFHSLPKPLFTHDWGEESPNWRWQKIYSEAIGSVQSATSAVLYHRENLLRIERDVLSFLDIEELKRSTGPATIGGGNTQKLDFEYHGFVFAYRRVLDYLARAIGGQLRQEFNSFRRLPKLLEKRQDEIWLKRLLEIHQKYSPALDTFLGDRQNRRSTRDRIAHYQSIPAGCLNANARGVFLAGGGESLGNTRCLGDVINSYSNTLKLLLGEALEAMEEGNPKEWQ